MKTEKKTRRAADEYVIGLDFGTDSVRAVVVNAGTGATAATSVFDYPRWKDGCYCDPARNQFRQHPLDSIEGMCHVIGEALGRAPRGTAGKVRAISVDTTGSTPVAVDVAGQALSLTPAFADNPEAMFILWKDHTAVAEADEINRLARSWPGGDYTRFVGGVYSAEWFWAKILHTLRADAAVRQAAHTWVEHCDWVPAVLTGVTDPRRIKRSRCAAGHKALWHAGFGGLPAEEFWIALDPLLAGLRGRLFSDTNTSDQSAGTITREWAGRLGLRPDVVIGVGAFDAHMGAVGGGIESHVLCKVMGTSTCDMLIAPLAEIGERAIAGICGQVDGSIVPGFEGLEAGQSALGDVYAWFQQLLLWPLLSLLPDSPAVADSQQRDALLADVSDRILPELSRQAEAIPPGESALLAVDWLNGRRTPFANQLLTGAITGISLGSDAPRVFRALVEATAFGARKINDCFVDQGVPVRGVIALGGIPKKSPFVMQTMADVLGMPIRVARSDQSCALGAAMCAAAAARLHDSLVEAQQAMSQGFEKTYHPRPETAPAYRVAYEAYKRIGGYIENEMAAQRHP
jgi:L-ribulokinase